MTIYNYFSRIDVTPPPALDGSATWAPLLQTGIGVSSLPTDLASRRSFPRAVPVIYVNGISIAAPGPVLGGAIAMLGGVRHIIAVTYSLDNTSTDSLGNTIYDYSLHLYRLDEQIALGTKTGTWQSIDTIQVIYSSNISSFGGPDWIEKHLQAIFSADGMNGIVLTESSDTASGFTISPLTGFTTATNIPIIITHEDTIAPNRIISDSELRSLAPHYFSDDIFDFRVYGLIDGKTGNQWKSYEASGSPEISNIGAGFNFNFAQPCANGLHGETVIYTKLAQGNEYTIMLRARDVRWHQAHDHRHYRYIQASRLGSVDNAL